MRTQKEREIKLTAANGLDLVDDLGEAIESRVFTSMYYDTPERALAAVGVTLRRRLENGKNLWQLKLPGRGYRTELEEAARLKTRRSGVQVREEGHAAEIVVDSVSVMDNARVDSTFDEIEIEVIDGDGGILARLERELRRRGAEASDGRPKLFRALGFTPGELPQPPSEASAAFHLAAFLSAQRRELLAHDP